MNKLLVICGPTATGKTKLAVCLASLFDGTIISADSRQVYKYMDIGTGKDFKNILGYDLIEPDEDFSVSKYSHFANQKIREIQEQNKLPILVGGTGLYIKAITDGIETLDVKPDEKLRKELSDKSPFDLFKILKKLNLKKANSMNDSDKNNPRRLIRAIEIANQISQNNIPISKPKYEILFIGLTEPLEKLKQKIKDRVDERIENGFQKEVDFLKKNNFWVGAPSKTLVYKDWPDSEKWKVEEFKYAKRQMTWFKKNQKINWFDITQNNFKKNVESLVKRWYS